VLGVNDRVQLAAAETILQERLRAKAMPEGATLIDPSSVTLAFDTVLGATSSSSLMSSSVPESALVKAA